MHTAARPPTWIEVSLNGPWGRALQPRIPIAPAEIVAAGIDAARAGASIVHFHAYDEATGRQNDDWETYARVIEGIRAEVDVIAYPTIPLAGSALTDQGALGPARFRHIDELGRRGLIEWGVVDPGSVNFAPVRGDDAGFVYLNPNDHVREGLRVCAAHGIRPSYAIYEPGFTRLGAALAGHFPGLLMPIYRFMFSDDFAWGFPPRAYALEAHLSLLAECAPGAAWMVAGLGVDVSPLVDEAIARGGHLRVGLEDARFGTDASNVQLVEAAARRVGAAGAQIATAADVRNALGA
jgi:3-keto-5-aminohexanoate cleavage enzyme